MNEKYSNLSAVTDVVQQAMQNLAPVHRDEILRQLGVADEQIREAVELAQQAGDSFLAGQLADTRAILGSLEKLTRNTLT